MVVQSLSCVQLSEVTWTTVIQAFLSFSISQSLLKFVSIYLVMPSNYLILCRCLLLLPSVFPSIGSGAHVNSDWHHWLASWTWTSFNSFLADSLICKVVVPVYTSETLACMLSSVWLFATPWTVACQVPLSMGFSRQEYLSGLPFPSIGDLPDPGI